MGLQVEYLFRSIPGLARGIVNEKSRAIQRKMFRDASQNFDKIFEEYATFDEGGSERRELFEYLGWVAAVLFGDDFNHCAPEQILDKVAEGRNALWFASAHAKVSEVRQKEARNFLIAAGEAHELWEKQRKGAAQPPEASTPEPKQQGAQVVAIKKGVAIPAEPPSNVRAFGRNLSLVGDPNKK